jgi:hypothetical protein
VASEGSAAKDAGEDATIAVAMHARRLDQLVPAPAGLAARASAASPARDGPRDHDPVADAHGPDPVTDRVHDARTLVSKEERPRHGSPVSVLDRPPVAVAHTARRESDQHLTRTGVLDRDRFDHRRGVALVDDGCTSVLDHDALPSAWKRPC